MRKTINNSEKNLFLQVQHYYYPDILTNLIFTFDRSCFLLQIRGLVKTKKCLKTAVCQQLTKKSKQKTNSQDENDWRDTSLDTSLLICQAFYRHLSGIFITVDIIVISNNFIKITLFCVYFFIFHPLRTLSRSQKVAEMVFS